MPILCKDPDGPGIGIRPGWPIGQINRNQRRSKIIPGIQDRHVTYCTGSIPSQSLGGIGYPTFSAVRLGNAEVFADLKPELVKIISQVNQRVLNLIKPCNLRLYYPAPAINNNVGIIHYPS